MLIASAGKKFLVPAALLLAAGLVFAYHLYFSGDDETKERPILPRGSAFPEGAQKAGITFRSF